MNQQQEREAFTAARLVVFSLLACLLLVLIAALAACAAPIATTPNAQRMVYQAEGDFAAALRVAVAYETLPDCGAGVKLCSDHAVVVKVTAAARAARASLDTAEGLVRSGSGSGQVSVLVTKALGDVAAFRALAMAVGK